MTRPGTCYLKTTPEIQERISRLHPAIKKKIKDAVQTILKDHDIGKPLRNELEGLRSLRAGKFRMVYRFDKPKTVSIIAFGPRKTIYEETLRLLG